MNLGILETGAPPAKLQERFGSYGDMFRRLLGPRYRYASYDVREGHLPAQASAHDAYVITGSASGVYDGDLWIAALKTFVQELSGAVPVVGICFGHQLLAEAYGGRVIKSPKGWGIGLHSYEISRAAAWMQGDDAKLSIPASHQDQVVEVPPDAIVLGGSPFTPYAILEYPRRRAMSLQGHPEFSADYATALIDLRRGERYAQDIADVAAETLRQPNDAQRAAVWIRNFLDSAA